MRQVATQKRVKFSQFATKVANMQLLQNQKSIRTLQLHYAQMRQVIKLNLNQSIKEPMFQTNSLRWIRRALLSIQIIL
ncbi:MAG: hypothetical protein EZS28_040120, partial [Streblomastix strix]